MAETRKSSPGDIDRIEGRRIPDRIRIRSARELTVLRMSNGADGHQRGRWWAQTPARQRAFIDGPATNTVSSTA